MLSAKHLVLLTICSAKSKTFLTSLHHLLLQRRAAILHNMVPSAVFQVQCALTPLFTLILPRQPANLSGRVSTLTSSFAGFAVRTIFCLYSACHKSEPYLWFAVTFQSIKHQTTEIMLQGSKKYRHKA